MRDIDGIDQVLEALKPYWQEIEADFDRHNQRFLTLAQADHDGIGRVLRAHLIIETFMNDFLANHYAFENLDELKLTFSQKAKLLPTLGTSATVVRPGIIQLNAIRNKFGHKLNHVIQRHEITSIIEVLAQARPRISFDNVVDAIEAFTPIACAFLSVPPTHLQSLFVEAFKSVQSYEPYAE